jgi:O-antigen/teichoic acid export membrane protein
MGFFIIIAGLLNLAQARCEMLILEKLAGLEAVGMYSVGLRFIELFDLLGTIAVTIYLPRLLAASQEDMASDRALTVTYRLALLLYVAVLPLICAMAGVAYFTLDSKFPGIHWLVLSMAARPLFAYLGLTRGMYMLAANRLRYAMACSGVGLAVSVATGLIFIPRLGYYGAAASAFCSYLVSNVLIDAVFNRRYFLAFLRAFRRA